MLVYTNTNVNKNPKQVKEKALDTSFSSQIQSLNVQFIPLPDKFKSLKSIHLLISDYIYQRYSLLGDHPEICLEDVARYIRRHIRTARRRVNNLEESGVLTKVPVYSDNQQGPNRYVLSDEYLEYRKNAGRCAQEIRPLNERKPYVYKASMQKGYNGQRISCVRFVMENVRANIYKEDNYLKKEETKKEERYAVGSYALYPASQCPQETWHEPSEKEICEKTGMDMTSFSQFLMDIDAEDERCATEALQAAARRGFKKSGVSLAGSKEALQEDGCLSPSPLCISTSDSVELRAQPPIIARSDAEIYNEALRCPGVKLGRLEIEALQREYRRLKVLQFNQEE